MDAANSGLSVERKEPEGFWETAHALVLALSALIAVVVVPVALGVSAWYGWHEQWDVFTRWSILALVANMIERDAEDQARRKGWMS